MSEEIDHETFQQLLDMDDDDKHEFSTDLLNEYFTQAEKTMNEIQTSFAIGNLAEVGSLGHYLKGSSAGVGAVTVRDLCDKIQHYNIYCTSFDEQQSYLRDLIEKLPQYIRSAKAAFDALTAAEMPICKQDLKKESYR